MAIKRETPLGTISISNKIFEDAVADTCQEPELYDRIWLAQRPNIKAEYNSKGELELGFSVYVKFGGSIKAICKVLADKIAYLVEKRTGNKPALIVVNVAGVRSNALVKRNMNVEIPYEITPDNEGQ